MTQLLTNNSVHIQAYINEMTCRDKSHLPRSLCHTKLWSAVGFSLSPHSTDHVGHVEFFSHDAVSSCNCPSHCCPPAQRTPLFKAKIYALYHINSTLGDFVITVRAKKIPFLFYSNFVKIRTDFNNSLTFTFRDELQRKLK